DNCREDWPPTPARKPTASEPIRSFPPWRSTQIAGILADPLFDSSLQDEIVPDRDQLLCGSIPHGAVPYGKSNGASAARRERQSVSRGHVQGSTEHDGPSPITPSSDRLG